MKRLIVGLAFAALLCGGVSAHADPIVITSGHIVNEFGEIVDIMLDSSAFPFLSNNGDATHMPANYGFHTGDTVDFSATINGVFGSGNVLHVAVVSLNLAAVPVRVTTSTSQWGTITTSLHTPFTMTGTIAGKDVVGAGTLMLFGEAARYDSPNPPLGLDTADWVFSASSPTPTPEPASLILLGTGMVGLIARRFRVVRVRSATTASTS